MQLPLLLTALLTQGTAHQAQFHPANADFYLEVVDPKALVEAMRESSLLETFRDPAVTEFVGMLSGLGTYDLDELIDGFWMGQVPEQDRSLLEGIQGFSLSMRIGDGGVEDFLAVSAFETVEQAESALERLKAELPGSSLEDPVWPGALSLNGAPDLEPWMAPMGNYLLSGSDAMRTDDLLARLDGQGPSLANSASYLASNKDLDESETKALVRGFARQSPVRLLAEALMSLPGAPQEQLGLIADLNLFAGQHAFRMGVKNHRYVTEIFSLNTESSQPLGVAPINPMRAAAIPTGILAAYATTISAEQIGSIVSQGLALLANQMGQPGLMGSLEEKLGFRVSRLFSHLGTQMTVQMQAIKGIGLPETALWIDLEDPEGFAADLARVASEMPAMFPGFEARTRKYKVKNQAGERIPYLITSLILPEGFIELPVPISIQPSLTVADGRLLVGLSSTHVKRELKRLFGAKPLSDTEANPWEKAGFELRENATSATFIDWGNQIAGLVSLAKALGPMVGDMMPIDFDALPDGETFTKQFRPTVDFQTKRGDGSYSYHEGSFGPEVLLLPLAIAGVLENGRSPMPVGDPGQPMPLDGEFQTQIALQQVRSAITIYKIDRLKLPNTLGDLAQSSAEFPKGYLSGIQLPLDGWGNDLVYQLTQLDGSDPAFLLYSKGPNGIDEEGAGDDLKVQ